MVAVRRGLAAVLVSGVVLVGLLAQATAYLAGFTTPGPDRVGADQGLSHARHGPHPVGVRRLVHDRAAPTLTVWYPATEGSADGPGTDQSYALTFLGTGTTTAVATSRGRAALAAVANTGQGPYPLVVLSSGFGITAGSYAWLAEHLASYGMVVVAPEHEESLDPRTLWQAALDRPDVVDRTRTEVAVMARPGGELAGLVDPDAVAVVGHSYGGYTALAAGGALIDAEEFGADCGGIRADDPVTFLCDALLPHLDALAAGTRGTVGPHEASGAAAVDAVVSLAGDAAMFGTAGLAELDAPLLVVGGTADHDSPFDWSSRLAYDSVSSPRKAEVALDGAGHFVFTGDCQSVRRLLTVVPTGFCSDAGWDRERARAVTRHFVAAFLVAELAGESTSSAALSPDLPVVDDVGYRAVGY